ncbi:Uncharacterized protein BP5553_06032 [Venustampulla echinocandica]|uniref:Uncharacterized protein n=1 Tax=Venustampulla echinocandica TaxID=2656787 RepID=A0A370TMC5_9HELO|nr:Uncharacterized protein BP5553_06032 [Venustampulla echinocandica]RDL36680.1 Uncharacterized protein BP5553_06032 [Venustampulla echinocandica]
MASLVTTNAVKEHPLQDSESSDRKPQFATDDHEIQRNGHTGTVKPQQLQRYWARTLVLILIPCIVTVWYGVIWGRLVLGIENDDAAKYRTFSGSLIYYSWFLIGVFGLSWSQYGLAGVEVAMLQSRFWRAPNLVALLMHSNTTWSSPSGWLKAVYHREFHKLWCLLTLLSVAPFIAFPLSGLVFEIGDGHIRTSAHPFVTGRNATTYNNATGAGLVGGTATDLQGAWRIGSSPTIPGFGVVYTPPGVDRTEHSCLEQVPNTLPLTESIPDMFLAPQADVPASGKPWGLRVKYNCSIVRTASEFTVLSEKPVSIFSTVDAPRDNTRPIVTLRTPSGYSIQIFNSSNTPNNVNMWSYSEMGMSTPTTVGATYETSGYNIPVDITQSMVFEYALWQLQFRGYYDEANDTLAFNSTLGPVIEGMGSPFFMSENKTLVGNDTFFKIRGGENFTVLNPGGQPAKLNASITDLRDFFDPTKLTDYQMPKYPEPVLEVAAPIGVRCVVSSGAGMATVDGVTSTFSDFERVDPDHDFKGLRAGVFGHLTQEILSRTKFSDFYKVSHLPSEMPLGSLWRYQGYVPSEALLRSVMLAYGMDALKLMYGVTSGFEAEWVNTNLTSSREGKILTIASLIPGHGTGYLVLALFCLWSGLSIVLGIVYGFRKRPSDKLDGYSMFRRGADMSEDLNHNDEFLSGQSFYDNEKLQALPSS